MSLLPSADPSPNSYTHFAIDHRPRVPGAGGLESRRPGAGLSSGLSRLRAQPQCKLLL